MAQGTKTLLARLKARAAALRQDVVALWFAVKDPRTPAAARWLAILVVAYALSPIDLIPDFIPVLGYLDELLLLPLAIVGIRKLVPPAVLQESRVKAQEWLAAGQRLPRSRLGAAIIIVIWAMLLWWVIALFAPALSAGSQRGG
jgi:uncharacterized membrane protein YkvA (DUF1232 family)